LSNKTLGLHDGLADGAPVGVFVAVAVAVGVLVDVFVGPEVGVFVGVFVGVLVEHAPINSTPLITVPDADKPSATITRPSGNVPCA